MLYTAKLTGYVYLNARKLSFPMIVIIMNHIDELPSSNERFSDFPIQRP